MQRPPVGHPQVPGAASRAGPPRASSVQAVIFHLQWEPVPTAGECHPRGGTHSHGPSTKPGQSATLGRRQPAKRRAAQALPRPTKRPQSQQCNSAQTVRPWPTCVPATPFPLKVGAPQEGALGVAHSQGVRSLGALAGELLHPQDCRQNPFLPTTIKPHTCWWVVRLTLRSPQGGNPRGPPQGDADRKPGVPT